VLSLSLQASVSRLVCAVFRFAPRPEVSVGTGDVAKGELLRYRIFTAGEQTTGTAKYPGNRQYYSLQYPVLHNGLP